MRALLLILLLSGCAAMSSPEATVGCQAADAGTTLYALHHGAVEANPLLAAIGPVGMILVKVGVAAWLLSVREEHPTLVAGVNGVTCGAAVHNLLIL